MAEPASRPNWSLLIKLAAGAVLALAAVALIAQGVDVKALIQRGLELIRGAGPVAYFTAMAILPAFGVPGTAFTLTAVPVFGPRLGTVPVLALALAALTANIALTHFLASRWFRPPLQSLLRRLGYKLPQVESADVTDLIVLLRVTPGIPFPVQNYLLGLAGVPFVRYLVISCLIQWPINVAIMLFSDALMHGKGRLAFLALMGLLALLTATHLVRKHYGARRPAPP
ncbi:MAG TPA: VTT domain-containing protein [Opitutaceae bacterium]|nr:VTT domain-containing protein [Opitutaceae bacterium]